MFDTPSPCFFSYSKKELYGLLLSVMLVGYCQLLAALGATRSQYSTAVLGCHSLTEAVLVHSSSVVRLKCSFHLILSFYVIISCFWVAKVHIYFQTTKSYTIFSTNFYVFFKKKRNFAPEKEDFHIKSR